MKYSWFLDPLWTLVYRTIMDISSLSNQEYVTLIGHYNQVGDKSLENQLRAKNYTEDAIKRIKAKFQNTEAVLVRSLDVEFKTNEQFNFDGFGYYYGLYRQFKENGVLPFEGCLTEQPAKIMDIFDTFERLQYEKEAQQIEEIRKKNK